MTVAGAGGPLLAFELGAMFASFGRIYSTTFFERLMEIDAFVGNRQAARDVQVARARVALIADLPLSLGGTGAAGAAALRQAVQTTQTTPAAPQPAGAFQTTAGQGAQIQAGR